MKPYASLLDPGTSLTNLTGSWRVERPSYAHFLPPCNKACPAGENIQEWLSLVERERYEDAWREIVKNNPFPAVMGRVCYHPCETVCNRTALDGAVGINSVERFIGDMAIERKWAFGKPSKRSGKKVLVVGAGPAGLSCAYHLALAGHEVTVMEERAKAGGMLRYGIPSYRLPRAVLDAEISRILGLGITLRLGERIDDLSAVFSSGAYDSVFLAVGAHVAKTVALPTDGKTRVLDAVAFLRGMENDDAPACPGRHVAVYGGGNTALDVARTVKRMGAKSVTIVYRRTRELMPAHAFEVEEALQENIDIRFLSTIKSCKDGQLAIEKTSLDIHGKAQPTGAMETLKADAVVLALGQDSDLGLLRTEPSVTIANGVVQVGPNLMTSRAGLFAGGDMVPSPRTVTTAIGHGKKAARAISLALQNVQLVAPLPDDKHEDATASRLNTWYYAPSKRKERETLDEERRTTSFDEVVQRLSSEDALHEARRCFSCGNCFECDNCYGVCPDNAIKKLGDGKGFEINYDYCKGCGLCAAECPCGCIVMSPEEL